MGGNTGKFRRSFFGGFNRCDVVAYLETIAQERNTYQAKAERLEDEARSRYSEYRERLSALEGELEDARQSLRANQQRAEAVRISALQNAGDALRDLKARVDSVRTDLEGAVSRASAEFERLDAGLLEVSTVFSETGAKLDGLFETVKSERERAETGIPEERGGD